MTLTNIVNRKKYSFSFAQCHCHQNQQNYPLSSPKVFPSALVCRSSLGWLSMMPSEGTGTTEDFASTIARYCAKEADLEEFLLQYLVQMNRVHRYWEVKHWIVKLHNLCTLWANNTLAKDLAILTSEILYFSKDLFWKRFCCKTGLFKLNSFFIPIHVLNCIPENMDCFLNSV